MAKKKIFISSVQTEFAEARSALHEYISADPLLGKFFETFLFELLPAIDQRADYVYLREIEASDIYIGLLGKAYGSENKSGVSPTEIEFDHATRHHLTRLMFLSADKDEDRHPKELKFIEKAQQVLVRKKFGSTEALKHAVYAALVRYLEEKEIIRSGPFDATLHATARPEDLDAEKVKQFVRAAQSKRGFPLGETEPMEKILVHLNLMQDQRITHAGLLLFGKEPQRFFISSEVKCASFHGTIVEKPIPSYKVFKGTVFELVDQAVDFVLSKLDYRVGTRAVGAQVPGGYEIPREVISEAIVNAVAHRDYTGNGSVQVMLFADRLEIWNPGSLPLGWTTQKLKQLHTSVPANPLLAEPMYLSGYIERLGTGTADMVRVALAAGLREPEFVQTDEFKAILYRPVSASLPGIKQASNRQVTGKYRASSDEVNRLVLILQKPLKRSEIQEILQLKHRDTVMINYLQPAVNEGFVELTQPEILTSPSQQYRLSTKGKHLRKVLIALASAETNTEQPTEQVTEQVTEQPTEQVQRIIQAIENEVSGQELMRNMDLKHRPTFLYRYLQPALEGNWLEMTFPDNANDPNQKYRLTPKGKSLKQQLKHKK